jgi:cellulose synthase/poly-beta-1,6-N-acetylglucosamine synthase-like glycosyltransferase
MLDNTKRISVIVPTYNRPDYLDRCIKALLAQNFAPAEFEIIVADDAASTSTRQQVEEWASRAGVEGYDIHYVPVTGPHHGTAAARNCGWRSAQAGLIAFTEDDCVPEMNWLQAGVDAFSDDVDALSGRIVMPIPGHPTDYEYNAFQLTKSKFVTANSFYSRSVLMEVNGFDERFTSAWREDSDLFFTLLEQQKHCTLAPTAVVMHPPRSAPWGISLLEQRKNVFNALLYKKHRTLYRQYIQSSPPWRYYLVLVLLLLALLGFCVSFLPLAIPALLLWAYFTGRFCIQRLRRTSHAPRHIVEMIITSMLIPPLAIFWRLYGAVRFRVLFL